MIDKKGKEGLMCIYCGDHAVIDTDPPTCLECSKLDKRASDEMTLDSIEQNESIWDKA